MPHLPAASKAGAVEKEVRGGPSNGSPRALHPARSGHLCEAGSAREGAPRARSGKGRWWPGHPGGLESSGRRAGGGRRARTLSRAQRPQRGRLAWGAGGAPGVSGAAHLGVPGTRSPLGPPGRCGGAAGRVLPVDLERERAPLCARQRGHGPRAAGRPLGARGADGGGPARRGAAAAHAERDASLICQSALETSAFPPSALRSPRGRAQPRSGGREPGQPPGARPGTQRAAGERVWTRRGTALRMLRPTARSGRGPDLGQKRARAEGPETPGQAGNSTCPEPPDRQRGWARGATSWAPAPRPRPGCRLGKPAPRVSRLGAGPSEGSAPSPGAGAGVRGVGRGRFENKNQPTNQPAYKSTSPKDGSRNLPGALDVNIMNPAKE